MKLRGIVPAMVTPMREDESVNVDELRRQCDRLIAAGAAALFCLGTNGEFYALSGEEKRLVLRTVAETAGGRIPLMAGTGCVTTAETVELTRYAKGLGYDFASVICPYFAALSQEGAFRHFSAVADACRMPVILYNIPARTGIDLSAETVARLARHPYIVGIKDSSGRFENTLAYLQSVPRDFAVLAGNDSLTLKTVRAGGSGGIAGCANVCPERMVRMFRLNEAGRTAEADAIQESLKPLRDLFPGRGSCAVIKRAMNRMGFPVGPVRAPFDLTDGPEVDAQLERILPLYASGKDG
ncbi:MAG: 4-hydroxy-tetrahydrodipicolinate synthase [Oscillospiraceae bacterium]|nr:4-hydroxy-tetrahydrodipicolinate synthase [Oscillospiraceae bacterium]